MRLVTFYDLIKEEIDKNGIKDALSFYKHLKKDKKFEGQTTEAQINRLGHNYLNIGKQVLLLIKQ